MSKSLRANLRRTILRGPLHERWAARRARQLDDAYIRNVLSESKSALIPPRKSVVGSGKLNQILLIADCVWEPQSLVPELARIASTRVLDLHPDLQNSGATPETFLRTLTQFAKAETTLSPDVILLYARPNLLCDEIFDVLRRHWKCPLFGMNLDDKFQFFSHGILSDANDNYARWARKYDLNLTSSRAAVDWYRARDCACTYLPPGFHAPARSTPPDSAKFEHEFTFVGAKRCEREAIISQLQRAGISIELFGNGWPGAKWVADPNKIYRGSQLNLGIGHPTPSLALANLKARDFECPGAGGCYLTTWNWELPLHFDIGKEILCYRNVEELIEMYAFYRRRPEECLKIAQSAWRRCAAEHTWERRFRMIFQEAGFKV